MEGPLTIATARLPLNMGFAGNTLTVAANNAVVKIQIFDMVGHVVESRMEQISGSISMNLDHMSKGSCLVRISSGSMAKTARIAVK